MTNEERIKAMSTEEMAMNLAAFFESCNYCFLCQRKCDEINESSCYSTFEKWLKEEAER